MPSSQGLSPAGSRFPPVVSGLSENDIGGASALAHGRPAKKYVAQAAAVTRCDSVALILIPVHGKPCFFLPTRTTIGFGFPAKRGVFTISAYGTCMRRSRSCMVALIFICLLAKWGTSIAMSEHHYSHPIPRLRADKLAGRVMV
jgi:hypothetical protein